MERKELHISDIGNVVTGKLRGHPSVIIIVEIFHSLLLLTSFTFSAVFGNMSGITSILRSGSWHFAVVWLFAVLASGCQHSANPPSEAWLEENFQVHKSEFDEIATIALSVPIDECFVYPGYEYSDTITRNEPDSIFFAELGEAKRARLDSLLQVVGCMDVRVAPANQNLSITCYRYGTLRGWSVNYNYMGQRPSSMTFVEDIDLYDAFLYWQGDKPNRPFPRKELDKHWHIEYLQ